MLIHGDREILSAFKANMYISKIHIRVGYKSPLLSEIQKEASIRSIPVKYIPKEQWRRKNHLASVGISAYISQIPIHSMESLFHQRALPQIIVYLDKVTDVRNMGSIIRSSVAFGMCNIIIPAEESAQINDIVIHVSQGAAFFSNIYRTKKPYTHLLDLKKLGYNIYSIQEPGQTHLYEWEPSLPCVLIFGSEDKGITKSILDISTDIVFIPVSKKVNSLNVAVAAGIVFGYVAWKLKLPL